MEDRNDVLHEAVAATSSPATAATSPTTKTAIEAATSSPAKATTSSPATGIHHFSFVRMATRDDHAFLRLLQAVLRLACKRHGGGRERGCEGVQHAWPGHQRRERQERV